MLLRTVLGGCRYRVQCRQKTASLVVSACLRTWPRYSSSAVATDGTGHLFDDNALLHMSEKTQKLADGILKRDRRSLSRAITLVESHKKDHSKRQNDQDPDSAEVQANGLAQ